VICLTAKNMNMFKFSDAQYAKIVYNYKSTKEKLYKTKAVIWYFIKRARSSNLCNCWNINSKQSRYRPGGAQRAVGS